MGEENLSGSVCVLEKGIRCRGGFRAAQAIESWAGHEIETSRMNGVIQEADKDLCKHHLR